MHFHPVIKNFILVLSFFFFQNTVIHLLSLTCCDQWILCTWQSTCLYLPHGRFFILIVTLSRVTGLVQIKQVSKVEVGVVSHYQTEVLTDRSLRKIVVIERKVFGHYMKYKFDSCCTSE